MITRSDLTLYLQNFLDCESFQDYAPNGLQIEGRNQISKICTAVTASAAVIAHANAMGADALLVHHGFFWRGEEPVISGMKRQRIGLILGNDLNLFAYHLPLDCHVEVGNNACLATLLDVHQVTNHPIGHVPALLWTGELNNTVSPHVFFQNLHKIFNQRPIYVPGHHQTIKRIAWCSGAAQDYIEAAHALGADAYLSGEISERTFYQAQELNIEYFACGHHATERHGIQALGEHLVKKFNLDHQFIDSQNPI